MAFCRAFCYAFLNSWFPSYLERAHGLQVAGASVMTMLPLAGYAAGHDRAVVVQAGEPDPNPPFKPHHDSAPMEELSTQQVIGAIKTLLSR